MHDPVDPSSDLFLTIDRVIRKHTRLYYLIEATRVGPRQYSCLYGDNGMQGTAIVERNGDEWTFLSLGMEPI